MSRLHLFLGDVVFMAIGGILLGMEFGWKVGIAAVAFGIALWSPNN